MQSMYFSIGIPLLLLNKTILLFSLFENIALIGSIEQFKKIALFGQQLGKQHVQGLSRQRRVRAVPMSRVRGWRPSLTPARRFSRRETRNRLRPPNTARPTNNRA